MNPDKIISFSFLCSIILKYNFSLIYFFANYLLQNIFVPYSCCHCIYAVLQENESYISSHFLGYFFCRFFIINFFSIVSSFMSFDLHIVSSVFSNLDPVLKVTACTSIFGTLLSRRPFLFILLIDIVGL